jgi:glycosyltransferase involved in cell wall biosynthesis
VTGLPLVSVVIAAHNAGRFLAETLETVLAQDHRPLEIVVVDDGSGDDTRAVMARFGADIVAGHQEHLGLGAAQNHGIGLATGTHLSFVDADDLWTPTKTSLQLAVLAGDPDLDVVFGMVEQFATADTDGAAPPSVPDDLRVLAGYSTGTMLLRREEFGRVGLFSETVTIGPFVDWYGRALDAGLRPHLVDEVVMHRRIHGDNMGRRLRSQQRDYLKVLKSRVDRKRAANPPEGTAGHGTGGG